MNAPIRRLTPGEPVPWFTCPSIASPLYHFDSVAGRHVLLLFAGSLGAALPQAIWQLLLAQRALFDDERCSLFVVTVDPSDVASGRAADSIPGVRVLCV